jgi:hypothetical protein
VNPAAGGVIMLIRHNARGQCRTGLPPKGAKPCTPF